MRTVLPGSTRPTVHVQRSPARAASPHPSDATLLVDLSYLYLESVLYSTCLRDVIFVQYGLPVVLGVRKKKEISQFPLQYMTCSRSVSDRAPLGS